MDNIKEISKIISKIKTDKEAYFFLKEIMTDSELATLSKRWRILKMLLAGTRGSKILKDKNAIVTNLIKE